MKSRFALGLGALLGCVGGSLFGAEPLTRPDILAVSHHQAGVAPTCNVPTPCCPEKCGGIIAGTTAYYLKPYFEDNTAFNTTTGTGTANPVTTASEFEWDYNLAYGVWAGFVSAEGVGIRGRYFHFDQSSNDLSGTNTSPAVVITQPGSLPDPMTAGGGLPLFGSPGILLSNGIGTDSLTVGSELKIQSIDLELVADVECGCWSFFFSAGARYVNIEQGALATLVNTGAPRVGPTEVQILSYSQEFTGFGPTASVQVRRFFGDCAAYASARTSLLIGEREENFVSAQGLIGTFAISDTFLSTQDDTLPILELEIGFEYGCNWGQNRLFAQVAAVNQTYFSGGSATNRDSNVSLFGIQASVGINR